MDQVAFVFDMTRCTGCNTCEIACRDRHDVQRGPGRLRIHDFEGSNAGRPFIYHLPFMCFHCANPPCIAACPDEALAKRAEDGVVLISEGSCTGCLLCIGACPFGALNIDAQTGKATKCDYCLEDASSGGPACALACPFNALKAETLASFQGQFDSSASIRGFPADDTAKPSILFKASSPSKV